MDTSPKSVKIPRHGLRDRPEYLVWTEMKQRCHNPNHPKYKWYGKRGIRVCKRWQKSFVAFFEDIGPRPDGLTIDRINVNKGYLPDNCRWATWEKQRRNKRNNLWVEWNGKKMILPDWAKQTGISLRTLRQRLFVYHWPTYRAFTEAPGTRRSNNRWLEFKGLRKTAAQWAKVTGISYQTLKTRLNVLKWSAEKALTLPVR